MNIRMVHAGIFSEPDVAVRRGYPGAVIYE